MNVLTTTVAKLMFAIPMAIFGLFHLMGADNMAGMVPIPGGVFWVYLTGLGLIAAAVSIIIGKFDRLATLLLATMLVIFALSIHLPGLGNEASAQASMGNLLKDTALAGGALLLMGMAKDDRYSPL